MKRFLKPSLPQFLKAAAVLSLLSISTSYAQTSGNVTLNVTLNDVLALTVNDASVALNFATVNDYQTGLTVAKSNQLSVTSNRSYDLRVKANGDLTSGLNTIAVNNVSVRSTTSSGMGTTPSVSLSTSDQDVATNANAAIVKTISMEYSTSANNQNFARAAGTYTTVLVYSVVAR